MKIAINIILAAVAIVLAVNILSMIDKSKIDTIKNNFNIESPELPEYNNYTLIPKQWGLDTIKVFNVGTFLTLELEENLYENRKIYVFLSPNNDLLKAVSSDLYRLQE